MNDGTEDPTGKWHRSDLGPDQGTMFYTLREVKRSRGKPLFQNDVTIKIERSFYSDTDIKLIADCIARALTVMDKAGKQ